MRFFERLRRVLVAGNRPFRIAGDRLVDPLDPFGRVAPPVAQLYQPLSFQGCGKPGSVGGRCVGMPVMYLLH